MDFMNDVSVGYFYQGRAFGKVQYYQNGRLVDQGVYNDVNPKTGNQLVRGENIQSFTQNSNPFSNGN